MANDDERLIQEVLAELGRDADPKAIAEQVKRLDLGLPAEDEFIAVCSWLGKARLVHKLDQHQAPPNREITIKSPISWHGFRIPGRCSSKSKTRRRKHCHLPQITSSGFKHMPSLWTCRYLSPGSA